MRPDHRVLKSLVAVIGFLSAQPLLGQTLPNPGHHAANEARLLSYRAGGDVLTSRIPWTVQETVGRKNPLLAGALSFWLFPGVGSYYAGDSSHGTRHLLIAGGSLGLFIAGATLWTTEVVEDCIFQEGDCDSNGGGGALMAVGGAMYFMNMLWATATAVGDANTHNQSIAASGVGTAQLMGDVYVQPTFHVSSPAGLTAGGDLRREPRLGLRFVRSF